MAPSDSKTGFSEPPTEPMHNASQYRQTVPIAAEESDINPVPEPRDHPPPYAAPDTQRGPAGAPEAEGQRQPDESRESRSGVDNTGYQSSKPMTWDEKDRNGYWDKYEDQTGCCFSSRGGYFWSDRGGWCFSDREGWWCSDRGGYCFSDRGALCFS